MSPRRLLVLTVGGALCLGLVVGAGIGALGFREDARTTDQYQALQADNNSLQGERGVLQGEFETLQGHLDTAVTTAENAVAAETLAKNKLKKLSAAIKVREKAVAEAKKKLQTLTRKLDARQEALDARQKVLDEAEKQAKKDLARASFPGDGVYSVGVDGDVDAGKYVSSGAAGCAYALTAGAAATRDVIHNDNVASVNLREGGYFKTVGCADWVKVV
jgi:hypothetical protein